MPFIRTTKLVSTEDVVIMAASLSFKPSFLILVTKPTILIPLLVPILIPILVPTPKLTSQGQPTDPKQAFV